MKTIGFEHHLLHIFILLYYDFDALQKCHTGIASFFHTQSHLFFCFALAAYYTRK